MCPAQLFSISQHDVWNTNKWLMSQFFLMNRSQIQVFSLNQINAISTKFNLGIHSSASQNLLMFRDSEYFFSSDRVRKVWHILIQTLSDPVTVFAIEHHVTTRLPRKHCYIWHWIDFTWRYSLSWPCIDFKRASKNSLGQPEVLLISAYQR